MAIIFTADKDFQTALYTGIKIIDTDNETYGVAQLNWDPVVYLEIEYNKGSEDGIELTFDLGKYISSANNDMKEVRLVKREYDTSSETYIDTLKKFKLSITDSIKTFYFIPLPISNDGFRINVNTLNGSDPDLKINIKSQTYRS